MKRIACGCTITLNGNYLNPFAVVFAVCDSVLSEEGEALVSSP